MKIKLHNLWGRNKRGAISHILAILTSLKHSEERSDALQLFGDATYCIVKFPASDQREQLHSPIPLPCHTPKLECSRQVYLRCDLRYLLPFLIPPSSPVWGK